MGYWDATDQYLKERGGCGPTYPSCGTEMFPADNYGRFICDCNFKTLDVVTDAPVHFTFPLSISICFTSYPKQP